MRGRSVVSSLGVAVCVFGCMSAPNRHELMMFDGGGDGALDRGVDGGSVRPPLGHLPEGTACGSGQSHEGS